MLSEVLFDWLIYNVQVLSYKKCIFVWQKLQLANKLKEGI